MFIVIVSHKLSTGITESFLFESKRVHTEGAIDSAVQEFCKLRNIKNCIFNMEYDDLMKEKAFRNDEVDIYAEVKTCYPIK